jgi:primosomal protein N''
LQRAGAVEIDDVDNTTYLATRLNAQITASQRTFTGSSYLQ